MMDRTWMLTEWMNTVQLISGFHRASLLSVTFINQLMHLIITVTDVKILLHKSLHCPEHKDIIYYRKYVDDLLIIYDQSRIKVDKILNFINIDDHLEFKVSEEVNNTLQYLDLSIRRNNNNIVLDIYRKPTYMDIMIHYTSNHPYDHKLATFIFYINRMITTPTTY